MSFLLFSFKFAQLIIRYPSFGQTARIIYSLHPHPGVSKNRPKAAFVKMLFNYLPGACVCTSNHLIKVVRRINTVAKRITVPYAPADLFPITEHLLIVGNTSSIALIGYLLLCNLPLFILFVLESRLVGIRSSADRVPFPVIFVNIIITRSGV